MLAVRTRTTPRDWRDTFQTVVADPPARPRRVPAPTLALGPAELPNRLRVKAAASRRAKNQGSCRRRLRSPRQTRVAGRAVQTPLYFAAHKSRSKPAVRRSRPV